MWKHIYEEKKCKAMNDYYKYKWNNNTIRYNTILQHALYIVYDVVLFFSRSFFRIYLCAMLWLGLGLWLWCWWFPFDLFIITFYGVCVCVCPLFSSFYLCFSSYSLSVFTLLWHSVTYFSRYFMNDCVRCVSNILFFTYENLYVFISIHKLQ